MSKTKQTNIVLLLRILANCFQEGTPINEGTWVTPVLHVPSCQRRICLLILRKIFENLGNGPYELFNKPQRVAVATILFK